MRRRRYTREILQGEADRWIEILEAKGFRLPDSRITVYTSGIPFEVAIGGPQSGREVLSDAFQGQAAQSKEGCPIVLVRLPRSGPSVDHDPLEVLIHELLHHVTPEFDHDVVYRLAEQFRAEDSDSIIAAPTFEMQLGLSEIDAQPTAEPSEAERREMELRTMEWLDQLWLDANGFPSELPPRSSLTGRFMKMHSPTRGVLKPTSTRHDRSLSGRTRKSFPTRRDAMRKPAKKTTATKKPATTAKIPAARTPAKVAAKTPDLKTSDEKRLARNAALREWRKANRDKVNAYMKAWKAKKSAGAKPASKKTAVGEGTGNVPGPQPKSESQS